MKYYLLLYVKYKYCRTYFKKSSPRDQISKIPDYKTVSVNPVKIIKGM